MQRVAEFAAIDDTLKAVRKRSRQNFLSRESAIAGSNVFDREYASAGNLCGFICSDDFI